ncbi:MAG: hypothetical protein ACREJL_07525, partial [Candidatus Methylomirabilales bacterium]
MNKELIGVLFLAFVPGIVLVIAGAVSMLRNYGVAFLLCLRFAPIREKLTSILREMHPEPFVVTEAKYTDQQEFPTVVPVVATRGRSHSAPPLHRRSY